ncbi:MAG: hypothetical protein NC428_02315, partial [Clostridium sp.]|nr:hypothetical protein [Clostridium sp.]
LKKSFQHVEEIMLPHLDEVRDYKACIEHYNHYALSQIYIHEDFWDRQKHKAYADGLLQFKVFTAAEYSKRKWDKFERATQRDLQYVKEGRMTMEEFERENTEVKERFKKDIALFEKYANNPENNRILVEELESRKRENTEILREYGLI